MAKLGFDKEGGGCLMKASVIVISLVMLSGSQAIAGNAERHVGYVFDVLDDGFYELKLLAEVDPAVDSAQHYVHYVAIEPYQIIINENVPLEEGGFRFTR